MAEESVHAEKAAAQSPDQPDEDDVSFEVTVQGLKPGHVLMSNIETFDGRLVLQGGIKLSRVHLERIRNVGQTSKIREPIRVREPLMPRTI